MTNDKELTPPEEINNPYQMKKIDFGDFFALSEQNCSKIRQSFIKQTNHILSFQESTEILNQIGMDHFSTQMQNSENFDPKQPIKFYREGEPFIVTTFEGFEHTYSLTKRLLGNYVYVMLYGNFEAFFTDLVIQAYKELGEQNAEETTRKLLATSVWVTKFDRVTTKLGVHLGKKYLRERFSNITLTFGSKKFSDPTDFLHILAEIRHLIMHYASRIPTNFVKKYPNIQFPQGNEISIPYNVNKELYPYLVHFSGALDDAFCKKFKWKQETVRPELLI